MIASLLFSASFKIVYLSFILDDFIAMKARAASGKKGRPLSKIAESREHSGKSRPSTKQIAKKQVSRSLRHVTQKLSLNLI